MNVVRFSKMVNIEHENGSLELTPDHVLLVDGAFVAARNVVKGSSLSGSTVSSVSQTTGAIINPMTTSGKILIAGMTGEPVVSSTASAAPLASFLLVDLAISVG